MVGGCGDGAEIDGAPLDVEDPIGRSATYRGEDTVLPGTGAVCIGALVVPIGEDCVVVGCPRQRANVSEGSIVGHELGVAVGRHINARVTRAIEAVSEGEHYVGYYIIPVVARVCRAWHDTAPYLRYGVMVLRRTAPYCVISREGRADIAECIGDRPGGNVRRHGPTEGEIQREPRSHVGVDYADPGYVAAGSAAQRQIGRLTEAGSTAWLKFTSY